MTPVEIYIPDEDRKLHEAITSEKINTISGYITEKLRKIPDDSFCGFEIKGENYSLTVEKVKDNRVLSVILKKKDKDVV